MTTLMERPPVIVRGQPRPLPLAPPAGPAPSLRAHQGWAALSPGVQARVRATFILVAREVLPAADHR